MGKIQITEQELELLEDQYQNFMIEHRADEILQDITRHDQNYIEVSDTYPAKGDVQTMLETLDYESIQEWRKNA